MRYVFEFLEKTSSINFRHDAAFRSELFLLYCLHGGFENDMFLESGLSSGYSTEILLSLIDEPYSGVDSDDGCKASQIPNDNFTFVHGDGCERLEEVIELNLNKNISVFIDGPKNKEAISLKDKILSNYKNVPFVALHDTSPHFGFDKLENYDTLRVFESSENSEYNFKYYNLLNKLPEGQIDVFNFKNHEVGDSKPWHSQLHGTYAECYPTGPGISIYSNHEVSFEL